MGIVLGLGDRLHLTRVLGLLLFGLALVLWPGEAARAAFRPEAPLALAPRAIVQAPSATVRISPATTAVSLGDEFSVDVVIVAGSGQVNAADVHLRFDPAYLAISREPVVGLFLTTVPKYTYDNVAGTFSFGAYKPNGSASGTFALCTVYFRALQPSIATLITYSQSPIVMSPENQAYVSSTQNGTVVIIAPSPTPTLTATPSPTPTMTRTPTPTSTFTPVPASLCLTVYHDLNRNQTYESPGEPRLPGAHITVSEDSGPPIISYDTTGVDEPRCFSLTPNRSYTVAVTPPINYTGLGPQTAYLSFAPGAHLNVAFAQVLISTATSTAALTPTRTATSTPSATPTRTLTATPIPVTRATLILPVTGGNLSSPDLRVAIRVPAAAVTQSVTLTLSSLAYGPSLPWNSWDRCLVASGPAFLLRATTSDSSPILGWAEPATVTACFGPGGNVGNLALFRWDDGLARWVKESAAWEATGYCVQTQTTRLGLFVVARPDGCVGLPIVRKAPAS